MPLALVATIRDTPEERVVVVRSLNVVGQNHSVVTVVAFQNRRERKGISTVHSDHSVHSVHSVNSVRSVHSVGTIRAISP